MTRFLAFIGFMLLVSCSNNSSSDSSETTDPATPAIQNVNGNVPDTSNSVTLNQPQTQDSSRVKDSIPR